MATTYSNSEARKEIRRRLKAAQSNEDALSGFGSRQPNTEKDIYTNTDLTTHRLLKPPYAPKKMQKIVEANGKVNTCIETYISNIDGYGHDFMFTGEKSQEKDKEVLAEKQMLEGFFSKVNEDQSFITLRKKLRRDYETIGYAFIEAIRYNNGELATLYHAAPEYTRIQAKQKTPVEIEVSLPRNGQIRKTKIKKYFRKFAMMTNATKKTLKWFKEFGDPRKMCAITGKYEEELSAGEKIQEEASEIIHLKQGNNVYGIPRWVGVAAVALGINNADYVNYDTFNSNGIPALAILVSGGQLTEESIEDIVGMIEGSKGKENWHKVAILEAISGDEGELGDKATNTRISFEKLNQPSDSSFDNYINNGEKRIRSCFRLPPLLTGDMENYSRSSSDSSKLVAEDQVFGPERNEFDEIINFTILADLGIKHWRFMSNGPKMMDSSDITDMTGKLARAGGISVNDSVRLTNRILSMDKSLYDAEWANIPIAILLELIKKQKVTEIEGVGISETKGLVKEAAEEMASKTDVDTITEDLTEIQDQLEQLYSLVAKTE